MQESKTMESVPFTGADFFAGMAGEEGLLRLEDTGLVFEYRTRDKLVGFVRTEVREASLSFDDIADVEHLVHPFGGRMRVRVHRMRSLEGLPGQHEGSELVVKCKARHGAALRKLSETLRHRVEEGAQT